MQRRLPNWITFALMGVFVVGVVVLGYFTFSGTRRLVSSAPLNAGSGGFAGSGQAAGSENQPDLAIEGEPTVDPNWIDGRVTVLLMGIDEREAELGPPRTDTMILVTVDPINRRVGMLSIPRDLWVKLPSYTDVYDRINTAYFRGETDNYPGGGGPTLARQTVQQSVIGRPVPYFATVNFQAFVDVVNQVGCIPITVPETIVDETYPDENFGYDPFTIEAGEHCLDGETLLKYARTRATYGSDFDRAARQQQVIYAVRDHVLQTDQLTGLIRDAPALYQIAADGLDTNLTLGQLVELGRLAAEIPEENICSAVIDGEFVELVTLDDGTQILVPDRDKVNQVVDDIFNGTGRCSSEASDLVAQALAEDAAIAVLNGSRQEGIATQTSNELASAGLRVVEVRNADRFTYQQSVIAVYTGKMATARYIATLLGLPDAAIEERSGGSDQDIEIILGADYLP